MSDADYRLAGHVYDRRLVTAILGIPGFLIMDTPTGKKGGLRCEYIPPGKTPAEGSAGVLLPASDQYPCSFLLTVVRGRVVEPRRVFHTGVELVAAVLGMSLTVEEDVDATPSVHALVLAELLDADEPKHDWHVPGRFEKGDRLMVTGPEGQGKSTLLRQLAIGAAIGEDSLAETVFRTKHRPLRVLLVDAENSRSQLRREFTKQISNLDPTERELVRSNFLVALRTDGLQLNDPHDRAGDRAWLDSELEEVKPDLLVIGPVWKLIEGDSTSEEVNRPLARWLDKMRVNYCVTLLIEAHTPHDATRPYGWSGWKRWPEFGIHLHEDGRLEHWRGQREERAWPTQLARSDGRWLWTPGVSSKGPLPPLAREEQAIEDCRKVVRQVLSKVKTEDRGLTKNEIVERGGRAKAPMLAAITRLADEHQLTVEEVPLVRSNGNPYSAAGYRLAPPAKAAQ